MPPRRRHSSLVVRRSSFLIISEQVLGSLLGGAIGDAWGHAYENRTPPFRFEPPTRLVTSDDTLLTVVTAESIVQRSRIDPEHLAGAFLESFVRREIKGVGASTLKALRDLAFGQHWQLAGAQGENAGGNGAAMRIAPVAFVVDPASPEGRADIWDAVRITHRNDEAYAGALAIASAINAVVSRAWPGPDSLLSLVAAGLPDTLVRDRMVALAESGLDMVRHPAGVRGSAAESVPVAIALAELAAVVPFEQVLARAIELGGDTDTVASMVGHISGTLVGVRGLPSAVVEALPDRSRLNQAAVGLARVAASPR
jgi:ADP-ribosyl-[dinitrogen reductase] hydrolase